MAKEPSLMRLRQDTVTGAAHIWGLRTSGGWGSRQKTARACELNGATLHSWTLHAVQRMFGSREVLTFPSERWKAIREVRGSVASTDV